MPYNGSGSFSAPPASFPAVSGALIESAKFNNIINDIASGLSSAITKDGQTTITANLAMSGFRHTGVGDAVSRTDYASAKQAQDSAMLWAGTAGGTANAITLTLTPALTAYADGQSFVYKSGASANSGAMTVNINGLGAKAIQKNGSPLLTGEHPANVWFRIVYDGAAFQLEAIGGHLSLIKGTATNNNADAGYVGEVVSSMVLLASAVSITDNVFANVTSISLTSGDWDVHGSVMFSPAATTSITHIQGSTSVTSATVDDISRFATISPAYVPTALNQVGGAVPSRRFQFTSTTTMYLVAYARFTVSTLKAYGSIWARRAR